MVNDVSLTGIEREMKENEIIVSKTDLGGKILYGNDIFCNIAGYKLDEIIGKPHNILRHPDMPKCVFKLLWDKIQNGEEIFAYVINKTKNGDHYWVFAHVTPSYDTKGNICGYHSNRRKPSRPAINFISSLYKTLVTEEAQGSSKKDSIARGEKLLQSILNEKGVCYDEFIFSL